MFSPSRAAASRAALAFVAVSVCLDALAQSMSFPILPRLAQSLVGGDTAVAARWVGWLEVGWAIPQFLAAPVLGALSDRFGRKPVIVISVLGVGFELILNALAPNIGWLLAGRILCGVSCGGQAAAMAYVADVAEPRARTAAYGWITAALWSGIVLGPAVGGGLAAIGLRAPFWAAAIVALAAGAYGLLLLPESLPLEARAPMHWSRANPWGAVSLLLDRPALRSLALALCLVWLAFQGVDNMLVLYTTYRYGWTALDFGVFCTALAAAGIAGQAGLAARAARRLGETRAAVAGLALQGLGTAAMGFAPTGALFWLANAPKALGAIAQPAMQSMMSAAAGPDEQGRLQGAIGSIASLTSILAPVAFTQAFAWTISPGRGGAWSGATLLVGAIFSLAALALTASVRPSAP